MSYSFWGCVQVNRTLTLFPAQSAGVPATVKVKVSQLFVGPLSVQLDSLKFPPGLTVVPTQVTGDVSVGWIVPPAGFCAWMPISGMAQNKAIPINKRSVPSLVRAVTEEGFFFIEESLFDARQATGGSSVAYCYLLIFRG
jgi:hypothetical protein